MSGPDTPAFPADITIRVQLYDETVEGQLTQFEARRLVIRAFRDDPTRLPVGAHVTIEVVSHGAEAVAPVEAIVSGRQDETSHVVYTFLLNDREQTVRRLTRLVESFVNRRSTYRVRRQTGGQVTATIEAPGGRLQILAPVLDISTTGCAVRISEEMERRFSKHERLKLALELPGLDRVRLEARICYRMLDRGQVRYGLEFDLKAKKPSKQARQALLEFVMRRQRAFLRARRDEIPEEG